MAKPDPKTTALDLPPVDPAPEDMTAYFAKCDEKLGMIPNVLAAYAFAPEKFRAFTVLYNDLMLAESGVSKLEREMIAVVVSSLNRCFYCLTAHGQAVRALSGDPMLGEMLVMNWRTAELTDKQRAMLLFAEAMTLHSHQIEEADRQALRDAGWRDRDIWDIAAVASFFSMSNRMASAVDMRPNDAYHGMNR